MKIGIISAMDSEHRQLADRLSEKKESGEGRFRYVEGLLGQNDVVLTLSLIHISEPTRP